MVGQDTEIILIFCFEIYSQDSNAYKCCQMEICWYTFSYILSEESTHRWISKKQRFYKEKLLNVNANYTTQHTNLEEQTGSSAKVFKIIRIQKVAQLNCKYWVLARDITTKHYSINSSLQKNQKEFLMINVTSVARCFFITVIFYRASWKHEFFKTKKTRCKIQVTNTYVWECLCFYNAWRGMGKKISLE